MRTVIDVTPVSSHTQSTPTEPPVGEGHVVGGVARLKARLLAFVVALAAVAVAVVAATIGIFIVLTLLGITALLVTAFVIRMWIARFTAGRALQRR